MKHQQKQAVLFLIPAATILTFVAVYPTVQMIYTSFTDYNLLRPWEPQIFNAGRNYVRLFSDSRFWQAVGRTCGVSVLSIFATLVFGFSIAALLNRLSRGRNALRTLFIVPMVVAPSIAGLVFKFVLNFDFGMVNQLLAVAGLPRIDFLGTPVGALLSVILVDVWQWTPFSMLVLLAGLESLPHELLEAARVDGATTLQLFRFVTLPLMRRFVSIVAVFRFIQCLRLYDVVKLMTDGGPGVSTETLNVYITRVGFSWFDIGYASALAFFSLNIAALAAMLFIRRIKAFAEPGGA